MPVTPTYPGVYIEELASGVRTITGVSTSVTGFVGTAKRGPIHKAVHILSYSDFERRFGGLSADSEMSYAVRQFFINGGGDAWVVRLAGSSTAATRDYLDGSSNHVLQITALDQGLSGNSILVTVDYAGSDNSFKLTFQYSNPDNPNDKLTETFQNLSMNSFNSRYVELIVNGNSSLVSVARIASGGVLAGLTTGTSTSGYLTNDGTSTGTLTDVATLVDDYHQRLGVSVNGTAPVAVVIPPSTFSAGDHLQQLCDAIRTQVTAQAGSNPALTGFLCGKDGSGKRIVMTSGVAGERSSVAALPGSIDDLSARLKLGLLSGGDEAEAAADIRPVPASAAPLQGGSETPVTSLNAYASYIGSRADRQGIYAFEGVDLFNILCLPGVSDVGILADTVSYCIERRAFLIVDIPAATVTPAQMDSLITSGGLPKSDYAALYYPWIEMADPLNGGKLRLTAPSGAVAGLYARTDSTRGVWKAPAGTDATVSAQGVAYSLTDRENGALNPKGVNCIRNLPVYGTVVWGSRTLKGADDMASEWKYVPIRRLALFLEESLYRGTQWVVFEPNDEPLWAQIRLNVGAFMHNLFTAGRVPGDFAARSVLRQMRQGNHHPERCQPRRGQYPGRFRAPQTGRVRGHPDPADRRTDPGIRRQHGSVQRQPDPVRPVQELQIPRQVGRAVRRRREQSRRPQDEPPRWSNTATVEIPSSSRKSPGRTEYDAITLERGVTHDTEFEKWANKVWNFGSGLGRGSFAQGFPQRHHHRTLQRGGPDGGRLQGVSLLGVGISGHARPGCQRQCRCDPAHQAGERGLGTRLRSPRAE